jgi:exopolyphosphatase/guanosine-5'-triphosphate,3'-diphosphate pyrophosphatase
VVGERDLTYTLSTVEDAPGRLNGGGPIAIIDIGSNSVRLVVYERLARSATPLFNEKELCGLGRGLAGRGRLEPGAIASALTALRRFAALVRQLRVTQLHVLATAAVRDASNGPDFIASVEAIIGVKARVLPGSEEARLSAQGVVSSFHQPDGIAGDLGGGSIEVVDIHNNRTGTGESFPLGGLRLEEMAEGSTKKAEKIAAEALEKSKVLPGG